jgi:hypothetical protein
MILKDFFLNTKKPKGVGGSIMLWSMNWGHSMMAKWGLQYLNPKSFTQIITTRGILLRKHPR